MSTREAPPRNPASRRRERHMDYMRQGTVDIRAELYDAIESRRKADRQARVNVRREWEVAMADAVMETLPGEHDEF